jgi:hypothetical protein
MYANLRLQYSLVSAITIMNQGNSWVVVAECGTKSKAIARIASSACRMPMVAAAAAAAGAPAPRALRARPGWPARAFMHAVVSRCDTNESAVMRFSKSALRGLTTIQRCSSTSWFLSSPSQTPQRQKPLVDQEPLAGSCPCDAHLHSRCMRRSTHLRSAVRPACRSPRRHAVG